MEIGFLKAMARKFQNVTAGSRLRKFAVPVLVLGLIFQIYFFRELVAAELLFGLAFAVMLLLAGVFYVVGAIGERGLDGAEAAARIVGRTAKAGYGALEVLNKKALRNPESAQ